jgi:hypothetical protein
MARLEAQRGVPVDSMWEDSLHPNLEAQEHLRGYGVLHAPVLPPIPGEKSRPLILVVADGWNSPNWDYFGFRGAFERCESVGP